MKLVYTRNVSAHQIAIADLAPFRRGFLLTRINVPKSARNIGIGSSLLEEILRDADRLSATIYLGVSPSDGLSFEALTAWYMRKGFKFNTGDMLLVYRPNGGKNVITKIRNSQD